MSYRNKTYVAFASEDIRCYRLMEAWRDNEHIDFNFFDAHDLYVARDTSKPESIKARLGERLKNAKQVVLLGSSHCKKKGGDGVSFLAYEVGAIIRLGLPVVVANLDGGRKIDKSFIPQSFLDADYYTISVSFQPAIIKCALDNYVPNFAKGGASGPHYYKPEVYKDLGL
ncbi:TIR domain-containing protein [Micromonospora sp. NPDC005257]|uniref:TIR domain-containing protein n=1 Tax=Micromonospora sp. NPDC005257 TaxID=3364230 RepID=UPI00368DFA37